MRAGETVAVIGCGGVGLSAINGAAIAGAGRIIAVDTVPEKLEMAKAFGATDVIDASQGDAAKQVVQLTSGGVHHSFEAVGLKATAEQSFRMLKRGGTANIIGMIPVGVSDRAARVDFLGEKRIQGSQMGSNRFPVDMPRFVDFYMAGKLKLDDMVSRRIKLEQVNDGLAALETGEVARSVIMFEYTGPFSGGSWLVAVWWERPPGRDRRGSRPGGRSHRSIPTDRSPRPIDPHRLIPTDRSPQTDPHRSIPTD